MNPLLAIAAIFIAIAFWNRDDLQKHSLKGGKDGSLSEANGNRGSNVSGSEQSRNRQRNNRPRLRQKNRVGIRERVKQYERKTRVDAGGHSSPDPVGVEPIRADKRSEPVKEETAEKKEA